MRIRLENPRWVVIWLARCGEFRAYPLFRAPHGSFVSGGTPELLVTEMSQVEQSRPRRSGGTGR